jgi:hypothetical protein
MILVRVSLIRRLRFVTLNVRIILAANCRATTNFGSFLVAPRLALRAIRQISSTIPAT